MTNQFKEARHRAFVKRRESIKGNTKECPVCSDLLHGFNAGADWAFEWCQDRYLRLAERNKKWMTDFVSEVNKLEALTKEASENEAKFISAAANANLYKLKLESVTKEAEALAEALERYIKFSDGRHSYNHLVSIPEHHTFFGPVKETLARWRKFRGDSN